MHSARECVVTQILGAGLLGSICVVQQLLKSASNQSALLFDNNCSQGSATTLMSTAKEGQ